MLRLRCCFGCAPALQTALQGHVSGHTLLGVARAWRDSVARVCSSMGGGGASGTAAGGSTAALGGTAAPGGGGVSGAVAAGAAAVGPSVVMANA